MSVVSEVLSKFIKMYFKLNVNLTNENKNATDEDTYAGALGAPRAGSPAFVYVFVFVLIFSLSNFDFPK